MKNMVFVIRQRRHFVSFLFRWSARDVTCRHLEVEKQMKGEEAPTISAHSFDGLTAIAAGGKRARFALIDD